MPIDNKVDIDTSGPEMDVDIPEENNSAEIEQPEVKEEPTVRPVVEEKEAEDKTYENEREVKLEEKEEKKEDPSKDDKEQELEKYSDGVQRRIAKLTHKWREAERQKDEALTYAQSQIKAKEAAEERVIAAIAGDDAREATREMFRKKLRSGELDDTIIELEVSDTTNPMSMFDIPGQPSGQVGMMNIGEMFGKAMGNRKTRKKLSVAASYDVLLSEEADKLLDDEIVTKAALRSVEEGGIVFLDEIDNNLKKKLN